MKRIYPTAEEWNESLRKRTEERRAAVEKIRADIVEELAPMKSRDLSPVVMKCLKLMNQKQLKDLADWLTPRPFPG
jgi:hypothetical protein